MVRELPEGTRIVMKDLVAVWKDENKYRIAFTVVFDHPDLAEVAKDAKEGIINVRHHVRRQKRHTMEEKGSFVGGLGWRKGYDKGKSHGQYVRVATSDDKGFEDCRSKIHTLVGTLEGIANKCLPRELQDRENVILWYGLDALTKLSPHVIFSLDYCCACHKDKDIGFALGCWLVAHGSRCCCKDGHIDGWYFYFPELKLAVKLRDGVFIMWDSLHFGHATVYPEGRGQKGQCVALCAVTQIQEQYAKTLYYKQQREIDEEKMQRMEDQSDSIDEEEEV